MLKKNKKAGPTSPKPMRKKAVKKIAPKPAAAKPLPAATPALPAIIDPPINKKYVAINETDPELQKKRRLLLIILAAAIVFLAISWFFSLRNNVAETVVSFRSGAMKTEIDNLWNQLKNKETDGATINQKDLDIIREEIIKKINSGIATSTWPAHQSDILGLQLNYPANWNKQEITNTLTLSSYPLTAAAPAVFGQIKIKKITERKDSLSEYLTAEQKNSYELDPTWTYLDDTPALKYVKKNTGQDIAWIVIAGTGNSILEIELYSKNGQGLYERLFSEILGTIKF